MKVCPFRIILFFLSVYLLGCSWQSGNKSNVVQAGTLVDSAYVEDTLNYEIIISTFLGSEQRNYYGNEAPDTLEILWKHYLGKGKTVISRKAGEKIWAGAGWTGQPLLIEYEDTLYVIQGAYDHNLKKINTVTGELVWEYEFDDVIKGTGSVWDNKNAKELKNRIVILQGSRLGVGNYLDSKYIPSYRAVSFFTGDELWRLDSKFTDSYSRDVDGSALLINDTAYLGLENSIFTVFSPDYELATERDGMLQPAIYEEHQIYTEEDVIAHRRNVVTESSPALLGDHIYIASGAGHIWGYNLIKREVDWDFYIGSDIDGSAIVTNDNCLIVSVEKQYITGNGGIFKLDPSKPPDKAVKWYFPTNDKKFASWEGGVIGSASVNDSYNREDKYASIAVFIGIDGYLYVVDHASTDSTLTVNGPRKENKYPTPKLLFKKHIGPSISTPIIVGNKIIAAGYNGLYLFEFDENMTFTLKAKFNGTFESTPVVHNKKIYIASRGGYFYCLGSNS